MTHFNLTSTQLRVTDPCYQKVTWCAGVLENVLPGKWQAEKIVASDAETGWGDRIAELLIWHTDYIGNVDAHELTDIDVGVDSGQAGFFDDSLYPDGETGEWGNLDTFYGKVCEGTKGQEIGIVERTYTDEHIQFLVDAYAKDGKELPDRLLTHMKTATHIRKEYDYLGIANVGFGVATHSGYGDGGYKCYVGRNDEGNIVAAKIVFITFGEIEDDV